MDVQELIVRCAEGCEQALQDERGFLATGDFLSAAECADDAELFSKLAFNYAKRIPVGDHWA